MIIMKFGGTSVQDAAAMRNVAQIVMRELHRAPLVVLSACAGVTNTLVRASTLITRGLSGEAMEVLFSVRARHVAIAEELIGNNGAVQSEVHAACDELEGHARRFLSSPAPMPYMLDRLTSFGERLSTLLFARYLTQQKTAVHLIDARTVIVTDEEFTNAAPDFLLTARHARDHCGPVLNAGSVVLTQGFIGATTAGETTTLGRGGSDYSAAILGAVLGAEEIQIWTDVDGILTADPTIVPNARRLRQLSFREAAELAYFGARVLHPKTILPAVEKGIPVRVLNSRQPGSIGTRIAVQPDESSGCIVKSVAYKEGITLVSIESTRMLMAHGFLARLFEVFAQFRKPVDVIATSEIGVSLTVDDDAGLDEIVRSLNEVAEVTVQPHRAVLCVVGENMKYTRGIAARVFTALDRAGVNVELISHGGSEINLTLVIREGEIRTAVESLHAEFFSNVDELPGVFQ
jgi:aspartate kinase